MTSTLLLTMRVLWLALAAGMAAMSPGIAVADEPRNFRIAGYLPDYRMTEFDPAHAAKLTDLIVFSASPDADGHLNLSRLDHAPWPALQRFKTKHRVRLLLAIGGWERSQHFAAVAGSPELRTLFVSETVATCLAMRLDGADLDWEHPDGTDQERDYALLLAELHTAFEQHGLMLSVTIAGWQSLSVEAAQSVDWINVMAYDHDGRHSTFDAATKEVRSLLDRGIPAEKITFGLPFYGRHVTDRAKTMTWREIATTLHPAPATDEVDGLYFNGPDTIRRKTRFALDSKLAGVMFWELGQDATGHDSLLDVITNEATRR